MEITRRGLLKLGGIIGAGSVLPGCARKAVLAPAEESPPPLGNEDFTQSVCDLCPAGCGLQVRRIDGRAVGVSGVAEHPINQGSLCPKGPALLQELYHPDRLKSPMLRSGPRGSGLWTPISWEEALRRIGEKFLAAGKGGALAAMSAPREWDVDRELLGELARSLGGRTFALGTPSNEPPLEAYEAMHGSRRISCDPAGARLLVSFGLDWLQALPSHVEAQRLWARLRSRDGRPRTHVTQVEPRFSVTGGKADSWLPVRPGTEGLVALAVAREMIKSGRFDEAFIRDHARGFDAFGRAVEPFTSERVSQATELPEKEIRVLTSKFLNSSPSVAIGGRSTPWSQLAVHALNALSGSLGAKGLFSLGRQAGALSWSGMTAKDPRPDVLLIDRVNPAFAAPTPWRAVLEQAAFTVVVSPHMTETAEFADIVLPCHTALERLQVSKHRRLDGGVVLNTVGRGVEPLHATKDPGEIFLLIARASSARGMSSGDFAAHVEAKAREAGGAKWLELPGAGGRDSLFAAPSGRFEFDALTAALPEARRRLEASRDKEFPLSLYVFTPLPFSCGEGAHLPFLQSIAGVQSAEMWESWAELHPETAAARGVGDGDKIWVRSKLGKISVKARVVAWAMPGVVSVPFGLGHAAYGRWAKGVGANPLEITGVHGETAVTVERT